MWRLNQARHFFSSHMRLAADSAVKSKGKKAAEIPPFKKILIANRGEIAVSTVPCAKRVAKTKQTTTSL